MLSTERFFSRRAAGRARGVGGLGKRAAGKRPSGRKLRLERLEERTVLSGGIVIAALESTACPHASFLDPQQNIVVAGYAQASGDADFAVLRYQPDGTLDPTFGEGGVVTTPFQKWYGNAARAAVGYEDGRILAAGYATGYAGLVSYRDWALARYNPDGSLDTTFGDPQGKRLTGKLQSDLGGDSESARGILVQEDGKIVVAGTSNATGTPRFTLARYSDSGVLDTSFGTGGVVSIPGEAGLAYGGYPYLGVAMHQEKLLVVGKGVNSETGSATFVLARYNLDGTPDTGFGTSGVVVSVFSDDNPADGFAVQADGKIVVVGNSQNVTDNNWYDYAVARYNADGTLDNTFGENQNGLVLTDANFYERFHAVAMQPDGRIVAAGFAWPQGQEACYFAVVRYNSDGSLDATFGEGTGIVQTPIPDWNHGEVQSVVIQADGKIVATGWAGDSESPDVIVLARYNPDGTLDERFGVPAPSLSINDVSVTEGNSGTVNAVFTVTRSGDVAQAVSVYYATANGTATAPGDYVAIPATLLSFAAGETSKTVSVVVNGDTTKEPNETFFVNLSNATGGAVISDGQGIGTILNDDGKPPKSSSAQLSAADLFFLELSLSSQKDKTDPLAMQTADELALMLVE